MSRWASSEQKEELKSDKKGNSLTVETNSHNCITLPLSMSVCFIRRLNRFRHAVAAGEHLPDNCDSFVFHKYND